MLKFSRDLFLVVTACWFVAASQPHLAHAQPVADAPARSLTLEDALGLVESRNEEWQITAVRIERSRAARREALAALLPSLSVSATGTRNDTEVTLGDRTVRNLYDWSAQGTASLTLFDGTLYPRYAQAGELLEVTRAEAAWRRATLRFEAAQTFYLLAAAERDVEIAEQTVVLREAYLEQAQAQVEAGLAIPLDVSRARTQLLEARQALLEARAARGNASDALASLLALTPGEPLSVQIAEYEAVAAPPEPSSAAAVALPERADVVAPQRGIAAAERARSAVFWSFFPRLDLRGDARFGPPTFSSPDGYNWSISLGLSWLIYDGGARSARLRIAETEIDERRLQLDRNLRAARADLFQALRDWRLAHAAIAVADEQVAAAEEAYEMTRARFESGLATSVDVTDASQALFQARQTRNQVTFRANLAAARYGYLEAVDGQAAAGAR